MAGPASILKHPIHPMFVGFPIALWIFSLICDVVYRMEWGGMVWYDMAFFTMLGGLVGALAAAVPGYLDYRSILDPQVKRIGTWHMALNLAAVALFAVNAFLRTTTEPGAVWPFVLSIAGVGLLGISGWLGGEMVYVHGVSVDPAAKATAGKNREGHAA
jgi:uncharacterized membrane protein